MREGDLPIDDELKELQTKQGRLHFISKLFGEREDWKKNLFHMKDFKVLKIPRVFQSLFYLLKYEREHVCERHSNKFFWKKAKHLLDEKFIEHLQNYRVLGPKEDYFLKYQTLNFIEKNLEGIHAEDVDAYNLTLGKLFKWIQLAIKTRKEDIIRRKALKKKAREEREALIAAEEEREKKRVKDLEDAEAKFMDDHRDEIEAVQKYEEMEKGKKDDDYGEEEDEEKEQVPKEKPVMPEFNKEEFLQKWEEENPPVIVPEPIEDDKDHDWYMTEEEEEQLIQQYFQSKEQ